MKNKPVSARDQMRYSFPVFGASTLVYLAFRLLGATKEHAWEQAKLITVNAIMDKVVEKAAIADPRHKDEDGVQAFFEGGPYNGITRFIEQCGEVHVIEGLIHGEPLHHTYRRTARMRGQQVVFVHAPEMVRTATADDRRKAA